MIVVRIELHSAVTHDVTEIGRMEIQDDGDTDVEGTYEVRVLPIGRRMTDNQRLRVGTIYGYARLTENIWSLVLKALDSVFGEKQRRAG